MKERTLFANSSWGVINNILRALIAFSLVPIMLSQLGASGYGIFSILMLFTFYQGFLNQLDFGYFAFLVKDIAKLSPQDSFSAYRKKASGFLGWMFVLNTAIFLLAIQFIENLSQVLSVPLDQLSDFKAGLVLVFLSNFVSMVTTAHSAFFMARHLNAFLKKVEILVFFIFNLSSILALFLFQSILSVLLCFLATQILHGAILIFYSIKYYKGVFLPTHLSFKEPQKSWGMWKPFFFAKMNGMALRQTDTAMISFIMGPQQVAFYDICIKIPSFLKGTLGKVSESFISFFAAKSDSASQERMHLILTKLLFLKACFSIYFISCVLMYSERILFVWVGDQYSSVLSPGLFAASCITLFAALTSTPAAIFLASDKRSKMMTYVPTLVSVINLVMAVPFTIYYGFIGTIAATVIQYGLLFLFLMKPLVEDFKVDFKKMSFRVLKFALAVLVFQSILGFFLERIEERLHVGLALVGANIVITSLFFYIYRRDILSLRDLMRVKATS